VAQYLVQEILNHSRDDSQLEVQDSKEFETSTTTKQSSKRRKEQDRSYRLPKSSRIQSNPRNGDEVLDESPSVSSQVGEKLVTCQSRDDRTFNRRSESLVIDQVIPKFDKEIPQINAEKVPQGGAENDSPVHGGTLPPNQATVHQVQAKSTNDGFKRNLVHKQSSIALDQANTDDQNTSRPSSSNAMELGNPAPPEIDGKGSDA